VVVLGDKLPPDGSGSAPDVRVYLDRRPLYGVQLHAAAIDSLLNQRTVRWPRMISFAGILIDPHVPLAVLLVLVGASIARYVAGAMMRYLLLAIGLASVTSLCIFCYVKAFDLYSPWLMSLGLVLSFLLSRLTMRLGRERV